MPRARPFGNLSLSRNPQQAYWQALAAESVRSAIGARMRSSAFWPVVRDRSLQLDRHLAERVFEHQPAGVQGDHPITRHISRRPERPRAAIQSIADDWVSARRGLHAELMHPPRLRCQLE